MNILITSAGRRVSLVHAFKNEISKIFPQGKVICADMHHDLSSACQTADFCFSVPPVTSSSYIDTLIDISIRNDVKIIIPTIDTELPYLAKSRELFLKKGINCIISDIDLVNTFCDKRKTNAFFKSVHIDYPLEYQKDNLKFPVLIKPFDGSSSKGISVAKAIEDIIPSIRDDPKMMFVEYINPEDFNEYTIDLYYTKKSELICLVPRKRIEVRGGEVSKGVTRKNKIIDFLYERINKIEGLRGCITFQLFLQKEGGKVYGIEVNPRFGGGYPLSYIAGANFPRWILDEYLFDKELAFYDQWESDLLMLRYDAEIIKHGFESR